MKQKLLMLMLFFLGISIRLASAQEMRVSGVVTDENQLAMPGANILIKGTTVGTVTDIDGKFSVQVPSSNSVLVISYLGYLTQEILVGGASSFEINLVVDTSQLDEVVVTGYGTQRKIETTGSISSVKADELLQTPIANVAQGLQGRVAGLQVIQNSAAPGGNVSVRIRGTNSIRGSSEPLFIIDGVQFSNGGDINDISPLSTINPNDIESVEVLKDASSTAIYGARGANGVIIITTKRGSSGKTILNFDSYYGVQQTTKKMDMLNATQFAELENEVFKNAIYADPSAEGQGVDWQDYIFREAPIQSYQLSLLGGNDKTQFAISANYFDQQGIIVNSDFKRYSLRLNLDHKINDRFKIGTSFQGSQNVNNAIQTGSTSLDSPALLTSIVGAALSAPPTLRPFDDNGLVWPFGDQMGGRYREVTNPLGLAEILNKTKIQQVLANAFIEAKIVDGLTYTASFNAVQRNELTDFYSPISIIAQGDRRSTSGRGVKTNRDQLTLLHESILTYSKRFGENHSLRVTGLFSTQSLDYKTNQASGTGFPNDATKNEALQLALAYSANSFRSTERLDSYMARVNYGYKDKLFLDLTARVDGSSKFGANNKYGYFPAVSAGWRLSEEGFLQNVEFISDLKLRASYGLTGNSGAINPYQSLPTVGAGSSYNIGNVYATGLSPTGIANPDLKWEKSHQSNIGFDISFLEDRFSVVVDFYKRNTRDLLYSKNLPMSSGYGTIVGNFAELENKGFEFAAKAVILDKTVKWDLSGNISINRNEVVDLDGEVKEQAATPYNITAVGQPLGVFKTYVFDGIYQDGEQILPGSGGRIGGTKVRDVNGDGQISSLDQVITGNPNPDYIFGITNNFSYKNFDLNFFINGSIGNDLYNVSRYTFENPLGGRNLLEGLADRWSASNPSQEYVSGFQGGRLPISDRFLEDGSFIRLKNITLGYNITGIKNIQKIRFYVSGVNLYTITDYSGFDPEVNSFGGSNVTIGVDNLVYPVAKSFIGGLQITF